MILFGTIKKTQINSWHQELKREVIINLRTTLSAQIFTVPLIFYYFRQISLISPITNLLISWTIGSIMILGIFLSLLGWVWLPLGQIVGYVTWVPLTYLIKVVELTAKIPFAGIKF